jgi:hypothetical protein
MATPREVGNNSEINIRDAMTSFEVNFNGLNEALFADLSVKDITLTESLLTPGLQTSITLHSFFHNPTVKVLDNFKSAEVAIIVKKPILPYFGYTEGLKTGCRIYRLSDRKLINNNVEQFTLHGCDDSLLNDARNLVSKSWKCVSPTAIVAEVLQSCTGAKYLDLESSSPARDYIAENIHPFQVVNQQADVALAASNDPSFIHYMTYRNSYGTNSGPSVDPNNIHHFRSLNSLTAGDNVVANFFFQETGINSGYGHPESIITHSFPCDFDYLSDILNGIDLEKKEMSSMVVINTMLKMQSLLGNKAKDCGIGGGQYMAAFSNINSAGEQDSCNTDVEHHLLTRQARMSLLESDKIALRLTVPWNPDLHAGKMIGVYPANKGTGRFDNYGTGLYLIHSMTHTLKTGGYGITTMDCVSQSVGGGIQ